MTKARPARERRATVKDLATDLGMSVSTVSRAFYPNSVVAEATRQRVLDRAAEMGYRPNPLAQSLITHRSRIVGLVVSDLSNPFYPDCMSRLTAMLRRTGMHVMLAAAEDSDHVDDAVEELLTYRPDVVVIMAVTLGSHARDACARAGAQCIFFNRLSADGGGYGVSCDNRLGGRLAADHLISTGHRHLAYVSAFPGASTNVERGQGFRDRALECGLAEPRVIEAGHFSYAAGYDAGRSVSAARPPLDGVLCANDIVAFGFIEGLQEGGLAVPGEVSVIGFDDIAMSAWPSHRLTTVAQPLDQMMARTVEMVTTLSGGTPSLPAIERVAPGPLILRNTTRPRTQDTKS